MDRRSFIGSSLLGATNPTWAGSVAHAGADPDPAASVDLPETPASPAPEVSRALFPGFEVRAVRTAGATIHTLRGGSGPPLLLLHGHPQTHVAWHKVAPVLARDYTVVLADLRGYGDSSKPAGGDGHVGYSPRAMARDMVEVMRHLGHDRFFLVGHDRGGRVGHRLALDHPASLIRLSVLDIAPTLTMYRDTDQAFATRYVWWFFQIQPFPIPEHRIGLDPRFYLQSHLVPRNKTLGAVTPAALAEYVRCDSCSGTIHAACEDYRAAAGIGLEHERADERAGNKITVPVQALWGAKGVVGQTWDVPRTWREKGHDVTGRALDCGHLSPEEQPDELLAELRRFRRE